jgi:hypothetical protein
VGVFAGLKLLTSLVKLCFKLHRFIIEDRKLGLQTLVLCGLNYDRFWKLTNLLEYKIKKDVNEATNGNKIQATMLRSFEVLLNNHI